MFPLLTRYSMMSGQSGALAVKSSRQVSAPGHRLESCLMTSRASKSRRCSQRRLTPDPVLHQLQASHHCTFCSYGKRPRERPCRECARSSHSTRHYGIAPVHLHSRYPAFDLAYLYLTASCTNARHPYMRQMRRR